MGLNKEVLDKDIIQVQPDQSDSTKIQIRDCLITGCGNPIFDQAEVTTFTITGTQSLTINGGLGIDTVHFTGNYLVPNSNLTVNAERIKVDPGVSICLGAAADPCNLAPTSKGDINFNAVDKDNGLSILGITTTIP